MQWNLPSEINQIGYHYLPSVRASDTSSRVTFSALKRIAMFCDFFGSSTLFSFSAVGIIDLLTGSFEAELPELQPKRCSILSSFNLYNTIRSKLVQIQMYVAKQCSKQ